MKKLLNLLGVVTLLSVSTSSIVACGDTQPAKNDNTDDTDSNDDDSGDDQTDINKTKMSELFTVTEINSPNYLTFYFSKRPSSEYININAMQLLANLAFEVF